MKAVIIKEYGIAALDDTNEQTMRPDYIKVKTVALAINPTDKDHCAGLGRVGGILGCDLSGIVEEVGEHCKSDVRKGDHVYGVCHGANLEDGAFAEYALVRDGFIARIPESLSFEEVATLGVGITTIAQSLYMTMKLPLPGEEPLEGAPFILVYGGSSATGTLAIQFAKLSGLRIVTTASPENFELAKSRGADAVFDYHDPECARLIKDYTKGQLKYVLDCVSTESSYKLIADALPETTDTPAQVVTLLPADTWPRKDITPTAILAYTSLGKPFTKFGVDFPEIPPHFEFGVMFWKLSQKLLGEGKIKTHPVALRTGGLGGIPNG
ncbi:GroES-like protein [Bimuria novae-zelandiae CBS 107.79]|uniref:GroES-like protein n=1 Tax=Bimuria novae-zelandiae CBS 107.79 TaxID=1447943 RepID=A0A6A5VG65_9PLEO|nr:GroES-like protein [Bimuria novae-zelandiae CBS 107.79]